MVLNQKLLKSKLSYSKKTGIFTWKNINNIKFNGKISGGFNSALGYIQIGIGKKRYYAHRLAWLYVYGKFPKLIDHINGNKTDNSIANLRECTTRQNAQNYSAHRKGKLVGSHFDIHSGKWRAIYYVGNKKFHIGYYQSELAAHEAYLKAINGK